MTAKTKYRVVECIAALFILLFCYTAITKWTGHAAFVFALSRSPLVGSIATPLSWFIPAVELGTAGLLFFPRTRRLGLLISAILMIAFTLYLGYMLAFVDRLPCSCGGVISKLSWKEHFVFNSMFTLLALAGWWLMKRTNFFIAISRNSRTPVEESRQKI